MSQEIVITGMHRSGTSLVSSLLQRSGIHIGEKLISANFVNPRGFFEDIDFYEFHEHLLHARGHTYLHVDPNFVFEPTESELSRAQELITARAHRHVWGWKDPRTCLFLDFWKQLLPDARFLFVYRHPLEVLLSLLRRGEFDNYPSFRSGLRAWQLYNAKMLQFYDQNPDRCLLVHINGLVKQPASFSELLRTKLGLTHGLDLEAFDQIFHANELHDTPLSRPLAGTLRSLCPGSFELFEQLNRRAELCDDHTQTDSESSSHLAPLAVYIQNLVDPLNLPVQDSLLQLLMSSLAPELTERMLVRFDQAAQADQKRGDQMWMFAQNLQRMNEEQAEQVKRDAARIESLTAELVAKSAHIDSLTADLKRDSGRIETLTVAINHDPASFQAAKS